MSYSEMILNNEKALLARYILGIDSEELMTRVKKSLAGLVTIGDTTDSSKTEYFLDQIAGKWEDSRSAEEMIEEMRNARQSRSVESYINPFEA